MWSLFSRDPAKDFAYEIGEIVSGLEDQSIWTLHEGKRKSNGEAVSIFAFDVKSNSEQQVNVAKAAQKRFKTLRHPNMLTYLDGLESDKVLYVVTEYVVPLETYIKSNEGKSTQTEFAISWGLHRIAKALSFLNNDCNLIHNNVCEASVFVDKAGEWKLGGVDYMYPASGAECMPPVKILSALQKYDPPEKTGGGGRYKPTEKWSTDMWGLGCLIWEVFNGALPKTSSLKTLGKIPKRLVPHYCELVGANPKSRPNPAKFLESAMAKGGFMDNKFVATMLFLEEIQIKEANEKTHFFNSLSPVLDTFPESFCKHKILPQLVHAYEYGNAGSAVLQPLFKLGKLLDSEEYQQKVVPCVVKLFSCTDRATRVKLLQQVEHFVEHLSADIVNTKIYPNICQGFSDTNPVVREQTIKSMLHLAAKLNYKNLNEDLLKHFARLQSKDDQGGIRTNTTVCLGKIACHINPQLRQKVLCSAYLRAMKDPFPPARQAGIVAMAATHQFFTLKESANRLLPALCSMAMDPEKTVRDQAFKAIRCFIGKLEKVSENPELITEIERDVNTGGSAASVAASWAGWAVSGMTNITSKIYKGKGKKPSGSPESAKPAIAAAKKTEDTSKSVSQRTPASQPSDTSEFSMAAEDEQSDDVNDADGWVDDNDWGDMEDDDVGLGAGTESGGAVGDGWEDDNWDSLEEPAGAPAAATTNHTSSMVVREDDSPWGSADFAPVEDQTARSASSFDWGQEPTQDDFFSSMMTDKKKQSPSSSGMFGATSKPKAQSSTSISSAAKLSASSSSTTRPGSGGQASTAKSSGGWGDDGWDNDGGWAESSSASSGLSQADMAKKQREEKRAQRQKEIEERRAARQGAGAMKLGTKKKAID